MNAIFNALQGLVVYLFGGSWTPLAASGSSSSAVTVTWSNSLLGSAVEAISSSPLLLTFMVVGLVGLGIGIMHRIIGR